MTTEGWVEFFFSYSLGIMLEKVGLTFKKWSQFDVIAA